MADRVKNKRTQCSKNFTRSVTSFNELHDNDHPLDLVTKAFERVQSSWDKLEAAQDALIEVADIDVENVDYLDEPSERHQKVLLAYGTFMKKSIHDERSFQQKQVEKNQKVEDSRRAKDAEEAREAEVVKIKTEKDILFNSTSAEFEIAVDAFLRMNGSIQSVMADASDGDKRRALGNLEDEFQELRKKLVALGSIDVSKDTKKYQDSFINRVEKPFSSTQKWFLSQLKDSVVPVTSNSLSTSSSDSSRDFNTKKEAVRLPSFKGDLLSSPSPYLLYPTWRRKWDTLIMEYNEKWHCNLLFEHLDESAHLKFVGYETDYDGAMERLHSFYGDPLKVVSRIMSEVTSPSVICDGDYEGMISYSGILENNFNRLKSMDPPLEHEMSNTSSMSLILGKFPNSVGEKWAEHIVNQDNVTKAKPFPAFVEWLISQKRIWERVAAVDATRDGGISNSSSHYTNNLNNNQNNSGGFELTCFKCRETGHKRKDCPKSNSKGDKLKPKRPKVKKYWCAFHKDDASKRCSSVSCQDLRKADAATRIQLLKDNRDCVHCCGDHESSNCIRKERICGGGKADRGCSQKHAGHELFCGAAKVFSINQVYSQQGRAGDGVVLLITNVRSSRNGVGASVFWDPGSSSNFVREEYAKRMKYGGKQERLCVTTLTGTVTDYTVTTYKCSIRDENNQLHHFEAYGLECITGALSGIDSSLVKKLFPNLSDKFIQSLLRSPVVDYLIGMKHPSWHPERAERTKYGGDLWLYRGKFGSCVGGSHQAIKEETRRSDQYFTVNFVYHLDVEVVSSAPHALEFCPKRVSPYVHKGGFCEGLVLGKSICNPLVPVKSEVCEGEPKMIPMDTQVSSMKEPDSGNTSLLTSGQVTCDTSLKSDILINTVTCADVQCHVTKTSMIPNEEQFIRSEALGTAVSPECGGCKCGKCPVPGSKYNLQQQQDLNEIERNLKYNACERRWYTVYPWLCPRSTLPKNDRIAYQSLITLERKLSQDPELAEDFCNQIEEMVKRGAAVVLSEEIIESWNGDYYYLPLVGVKGKKKWLRVCFDASRRQGGHPSMNECMRKGPDRFLNNLLSVQLGFRNGRIGCVADISKFHNQVYLEERDVHMQRFLWRSMNTCATPQTYAMRVNNFGVKPANCIATSALHQSADHFKDIYPEESQELKCQTYIDDELVAAINKSRAFVKTSRLDEICEHAGMPNKGWTYTGDDKGDVLINGERTEGEDEKVLGSLWDPKSDTFKFQVTLCFKVKGSPDIQVSTLEELQNLPHYLFTRRSMLSNVHRIFDPMGLLIPVLLQSKLLMRDSWKEKGIDWDDPLPDDLRTRWFSFLASLLLLRDVRFSRSLWPEEEVIGLPILIIFTDGSALAFGAAAYIRWRLASGSFWCRLIMAKGKIAPSVIVTIPRMELNGAQLGNRVKNFLMKETSLKFEKVYQLVDSSTVLGYVHKECGVFHPYEGIRVAEIQSSNIFNDGKLEGWAWVAGDLNPADWCTKPRSAEKVSNNSFWKEGPEFLSQEEALWPIKFTYKTERLEGEVTIGKKQVVFFQSCFPDILGRLVDRISVWKRLLRVLCWILRLGTSGGEKPNSLSTDELQHAKTTMIKYTQKDLVIELSLAAEKGAGRFRKLAPVCDADGVWRVGSRLKNFTPFTADKKMPVIVPPDHQVTLLVMRDAHLFSHAGLDGTLSRFHMNGFWTVRAGHLAKAVKNQCVPCRKVDGVTCSQVMGEIPEERFTNLKPWAYCQIDLFGPFSCRGDVNGRASKKTWAIIVEDMNSGAVHMDVVADYSSDAVILSMWRFGSLRGWPSVVQSDPGSQLVSAGGKLVSWWNEMHEHLQTFAGSEKKDKTGFKWEISPADSPWRQGKVEKRIGYVKRLMKLSVGDTRLTPLELQTCLMEESNICNERPLGGLKPRDDGTFEAITPNQLLLGRSENLLPDDNAILDNLPMNSRFRVINQVSSSFWQRWCTLVAPSLVVRQKWHKKCRNIKVGDLVMIADSGKIKGKYKLGIVIATNVSGDSLVRSATIQYFIKRGVSEQWSAEKVVRSVQRLSLILSVEEQEVDLMVKDGHVHMQVCCADRS